MRDNPFSGDNFIFRTKKADRIKIVAWDGTGLWLHQKRLEARNFAWPTVKDGTEARASLGRYFDFYNRRRPHSSFGGRTPDRVYFDNLPQAVAA